MASLIPKRGWNVENRWPRGKWSELPWARHLFESRNQEPVNFPQVLPQRTGRTLDLRRLRIEVPRKIGHCCAAFDFIDWLPFISKHHQTWHLFIGFIELLTGQLKASANSFELETAARTLQSMVTMVRLFSIFIAINCMYHCYISKEGWKHK